MIARFAILPLVFGLAMVAPAAAKAPGQSLRPVARPVQGQIVRPDAMVLVTRAPGVQVSLRPMLRPQFNTGRGFVLPDDLPRSEPVQVVARGSVCGVRGIKGQKIRRIPGRLPGCGVRLPVQITSVAGILLSQPATMDCTTAKALNSWVKRSVKPNVRQRGGGAASLQVVAHYSCRTRNSQPGARISEHGKGHAIDISAINLNDGSSIRVLDDWGNRRNGRILQRLHQEACGPFGTVLGPNADRFHQDHFHLDTADHRGGSYCR